MLQKAHLTLKDHRTYKIYTIIVLIHITYTAFLSQRITTGQKDTDQDTKKLSNIAMSNGNSYTQLGP